MCMYIYIYIYMYTYMHIYIYIYKAPQSSLAAKAGEAREGLRSKRKQ